MSTRKIVSSLTVVLVTLSAASFSQPPENRDGTPDTRAENEQPGSRYYGSIDPEQIAISGFSCGGIQALTIATVLGGPVDIAYANGLRDYETIDHVPVAVANVDKGHGGDPEWEYQSKGL